MNSVTQTQAGSPGPGPLPPPSYSDWARQLLDVATRATPLDRDTWSGNPRFGEQPAAVVGKIMDSVAFTSARARMLPAERHFASPLQAVNPLGSCWAAFYRDVATQGPRRMDEGATPASASWQRPVVRPVRDAFARVNAPVGSWVGIVAQLGVDAGIGLCAVVRAAGLLIMLQPVCRDRPVGHAAAPCLRQIAHLTGCESRLGDFVHP